MTKNYKLIAMSVLSRMTTIKTKIDIHTIEKMARLIERQDKQGIKIQPYEFMLMWQGLKK